MVIEAGTYLEIMRFSPSQVPASAAAASSIAAELADRMAADDNWICGVNKQEEKMLEK